MDKLDSAGLETESWNDGGEVPVRRYSMDDTSLSISQMIHTAAKIGYAVVDGDAREVRIYRCDPEERIA